MTDKLMMEEMSWQEIADSIAAGQTTVILAVGAIEQHRPHLPTGTDTYLGYALAEMIARRLGDALVAPVMRPALSEHHADFPGTIFLSMRTFIKVLEEYCYTLAEHGFRDLVLISSHGGNDAAIMAAMPVIARKLKNRCGVHMVLPNLREAFEKIYKKYGVT